MDPIQLLKQQHEEIKALLSRVEEMSGEPADACTRVAHQAIDKLAIHAELEEAYLYPTVKQAVQEDENREMVLEAYEEHHVAKVLIAEIKQSSAENENFLAKCIVLREIIEHHIEDEEAALFPLAQTCLGDARLDRLGEQIENRLNQIANKPPRIRVTFVEEPAVARTD